jgi:hypothetical protein
MTMFEDTFQADIEPEPDGPGDPDLSDLQIHPLCAVLRKHFGHNADESGVLYRSVAEHGLIGIAVTLDAAFLCLLVGR